MASFDGVTVTYEGPHRWNGKTWVEGDTFTLNGPNKGDLGVELAPSASGLERPTKVYRYDSVANGSQARFRDAVAEKRKLTIPINILAETSRELRENKNRWFRNHSEDNPGKLWFRTPEGIPRYMLARKSVDAALGSMDKDPHIRNLYEGFEWGWESDGAYFYGEDREVVFKKHLAMTYKAEVENPSTAPEVFPKLYLYGPGVYRFSLGWMQGNFDTVDIPSGSVVQIDFHPQRATYKMMDAKGKVSNMWPYAFGKRPKFSLEAESTTSMEVICLRGTPSRPPLLTFTPEFESWT